jgi:hypothetical protein
MASVTGGADVNNPCLQKKTGSQAAVMQGTAQRHFTGTNFESRKLLKNAVRTPSWVVS